MEKQTVALQYTQLKGQPLNTWRNATEKVFPHQQKAKHYSNCISRMAAKKQEKASKMGQWQPGNGMLFASTRWCKDIEPLGVTKYRVTSVTIQEGHVTTLHTGTGMQVTVLCCCYKVKSTPGDRQCIYWYRDTQNHKSNHGILHYLYESISIKIVNWKYISVCLWNTRTSFNVTKC